MFDDKVTFATVFELFVTILTASALSIEVWRWDVPIGWRLILFVLANALVAITGLTSVDVSGGKSAKKWRTK